MLRGGGGLGGAVGQDSSSFAVTEWNIKALAMEFKKRNKELGTKTEKMNELIEERKELVDWLLDLEWEEHLKREETMIEMGGLVLIGQHEWDVWIVHQARRHRGQRTRGGPQFPVLILRGSFY
jgi:hypothetical protein